MQLLQLIKDYYRVGLFILFLFLFFVFDAGSLRVS
jgi:hypothetical protein